MKTKFLSESAVMINGTTWSITEPVLDNLRTEGEVAFFSQATHVDKEGDVNEIAIHWPSENGEWSDLNEDDFYVAYQDQHTLEQVLKTRIEVQIMNKITFEITREEELLALDMGGEELPTLGGCPDNGSGLGLSAWQYEFDVEVTNQDRDKGKFTVVFQPEERNNSMKAYSGHEITTASGYGCDADQSGELEQFCYYDSYVIDALYKKAKQVARDRLSSLLQDED